MVNQRLFRWVFICVVLAEIFFIIGCGVERTQPTELVAEEAGNKSSPFTFTTALSDGRRQFHIRKCAECHGVAGLGGMTGTEAALLKDFERPQSFKEAQNLKQWDNVLQVADVIRYGITDTKIEYGHAHPFLSDEEILNMALYSLYLGHSDELSPEESPPFSSGELDEWRRELEDKRKLR